MLLKFRPIDKHFIDLFLLMAPTTPIRSISRLLSLRSNPETHRISVKANSSTAQPFDLNSFEDKFKRISVADSLQANPRRIAFRASGWSLHWDKLTVRKKIAVEKNFFTAAGIIKSLWFDFFELNWLQERLRWTKLLVHPCNKAPKTLSKLQSAFDKSKWTRLLGWARKL